MEAYFPVFARECADETKERHCLPCPALILLPYERKTEASMDGENAGSKKRTKRAVYENDAARARAWRQRQKDLIAAASKPAEPVIVEKIVEKVVERIVDRPVSVPAPEKKARIPKSEPSADRLLPILKERFAGSRGLRRSGTEKAVKATS